jgi:hypothetical protein
MKTFGRLHFINYILLKTFLCVQPIKELKCGVYIQTVCLLHFFSHTKVNKQFWKLESVMTQQLRRRFN